jgi:hypothetical protein
MLALGAAVLLTATLLPGAPAGANHPNTPRPILECADVNGDGPVSGGDIGNVVTKFGQSSADGRAVPGGYHPLYDLVPQVSPGGSISGGDIGVVVSDFGTSCAGGPDTQIAQAARAIMDPMFVSVLCDPLYKTAQPQDLVPTNCGGSQQFLTENPAFLATRNYVSGSTVDVPGQGVHYVNLSAGPNLQWDGVFNPARPEGLVYDGGKLVAQLYNVVGDPASGGVGWGPEPPPPDQNEIDAFCTPQYPNTTACSWKGPYDGWHVHANLCMTWLGTQWAQFSIQPSDAACLAFHQSQHGGAGTYRWEARIGWMGHMWNHWINPNVNPADVSGNGRFADCFPDAQHWTAFSCPQ